MAQQSMRRDQENQSGPTCAKARYFDLDLIFELPYGPAAYLRPHQRPDRRLHPDYARQIFPKISLALLGAFSNRGLHVKAKCSNSHSRASFSSQST